MAVLKKELGLATLQWSMFAEYHGMHVYDAGARHIKGILDNWEITTHQNINSLEDMKTAFETRTLKNHSFLELDPRCFNTSDVKTLDGIRNNIFSVIYTDTEIRCYMNTKVAVEEPDKYYCKASSEQLKTLEKAFEEQTVKKPKKSQGCNCSRDKKGSFCGTLRCGCRNEKKSSQEECTKNCGCQGKCLNPLNKKK